MANSSCDKNNTNQVSYIDNLRIFLTSFVVCHHLAIAFGAPGGWYYVVRRPDDIPSIVLLTVFVAVNQAFFMSLFFFVAAYFTPLSWEAKGTARFIRERLVRLGIPLVVYFLFLNPTLAYIVHRYRDAVEPGYFNFMLHQGRSILAGAHFGSFWRCSSSRLYICFSPPAAEAKIGFLPIPPINRF